MKHTQTAWEEAGIRNPQALDDAMDELCGPGLAILPL